MDKKAVPKALLTAEITQLMMACYGSTSDTKVDVDVMIPKLTFEVERRGIDRELGEDE